MSGDHFSCVTQPGRAGDRAGFVETFRHRIRKTCIPYQEDVEGSSPTQPTLNPPECLDITLRW